MSKNGFSIATCTVGTYQPDWQEFAKIHGPIHRTIGAAVRRHCADVRRVRRECGPGSRPDQFPVKVKNGRVVRALDQNEMMDSCI